MKTPILAILIAVSITAAYSQRDPNREIIVYFKGALTLEPVSRPMSGKDYKINFSEQLKNKLGSLKVEEANIYSADPLFNEADTIKIMGDGTVLSRINMKRLCRIRLKPGQDKDELIEELNKLPEVIYAEPNGFTESKLQPSDQLYQQYQWHHKNNYPSGAGADIHSEQAWSIYTGNPNNIIAIVDLGIDITHPDLNDKILGGDIGYTGNHGTLVAGAAAAESNNTIGVAGVDWQAKIHPQRIDNTDDIEKYTAIVDAVNYSQNVHVLNHSWSTPLGYDQNGIGIPGRYSITIRQAFAYAYKANRTSVVAMGNEQESYPNATNYPAGFVNVIAVGATDVFDNIRGSSSQGSHIDVAAPGQGIMTTDINGGYYPASGTSLATPLVSGIASLLKGYNPSLANDDIENVIRYGADDKGAPGFDQAFGMGRVNSEKALNLLRPPYTLNQWNTVGGTVYSSSGTYVMQVLGASGLASGNYIVKRYEVRKSISYPKSFCQFIGSWGRGVFSTGWSGASPNYGEGFCEIVPGTASSTGATFRTYVYQVWTTGNTYVGYYPSTPANAVFAYSALGIENPSISISAPSVICSNGTFALQPVPPGYTATWAASPSNVLTPSSGTGGSASITITDPNYSGGAQVTFALQGDCPNLVQQTPFWIGTPVVSIESAAYYYEVCAGEIFAMGYTPTTGNQRISGQYWSCTNCSLTTDAYGSTVNVQAPGSGYFTASVDVTNACGTSPNEKYFVAVDEIDGQPCQLYLQGGGEMELSISPNPTSDLLTIEMTNGNSKTPNQTLNVNLVNENQVVVAKESSSHNRLTIETKYLKGGVYYLQCQQGENSVTRRILIKH